MAYRSAGNQGDGDFDNIFEKEADHLPNNADKGSARFGGGTVASRYQEKIFIEDSEVQTFGRMGQPAIETTALGENQDSDKYKTFKQNAKYNKYSQKERPRDAPEERYVLDNRAKQALENDDLGEVGEWAGMTLNRNQPKKVQGSLEEDEEEEEDLPRKPAPDNDDEFDFDNSAPKPAVKPVAGHSTQDKTQEALQKKIQDKLNGNYLRPGAGVGANGLSNRLAIKQKEIAHKSDLPSISDAKEAETRPSLGMAGPSNQSITLSESQSTFKEVPKKTENRIARPELQPHIQSELNYSLGPQHFDDDEWEQVNKQNKDTLKPVEQSTVASKG